jgi:hypothetical protein
MSAARPLFHRKRKSTGGLAKSAPTSLLADQQKKRSDANQHCNQNTDDERNKPMPPRLDFHEVKVAVRTSRLFCKKAGKTRIFSPVQESSGESPSPDAGTLCLFHRAVGASHRDDPRAWSAIAKQWRQIAKQLSPQLINRPNRCVAGAPLDAL